MLVMKASLAYGDLGQSQQVIMVLLQHDNHVIGPSCGGLGIPISGQGEISSRQVHSLPCDGPRRRIHTLLDTKVHLIESRYSVSISPATLWIPVRCAIRRFFVTSRRLTQTGPNARPIHLITYGKAVNVSMTRVLPPNTTTNV
jgi:hypothetical protein